MNKLVQSYIKKYGSTFKAILELHRMVKYLKQQNSLLQRSIDVLLIDEGHTEDYQEDPKTIDNHYYHKHLYYYGGASDVVSLPQFIKNYDPLKYGDINTFSPKSCPCVLCIGCDEGSLHYHHDGCPSCDRHLVPTGDDRHKIITDDGRVPAGHTFDEIHNQPENRAFDAKYSRS